MNVNKNFNIHPVAIAFFHYMCGMMEEMEGHCLATPFYNGRESGVILLFLKNPVDRHGLAVAVGNNRNSDDLFIQVETVKNGINPPSWADFSEASYRARRLVDFGRFDLASEIVLKEVEGWFRLPKADTH